MERFTTVDGLESAYATCGSIDTGVPVVLHHGFAASHRTNWVAAGMVDALTAAGHSVVALDARGHGESDHPHDPALYGESLMSIDVIDLVASLGIDEYDLVGYSMGGIVAALVGTRDPRVRRL